MRAVHAIHILRHAEQAAAHFQGGEMQCHKDHALTVGFSLTQMLQAFDAAQAAQALSGPPPGDRHFKEGNPRGCKVLL